MNFEIKTGINLFHCDCMDLMRETPDKFYDLCICDPPYGMGNVVYMPRTRKNAFGGFIDTYEITVANIDGNQRGLNKVSVVHTQVSDTTIQKFSEANASPLPEYFEELFRVSRNQIIWGGNYYILPPSRGFIIWKKTTVAESFSMAMCEYAWCSFNSNAKLWEGAPQGNSKNSRIHPTQKPVQLYKWLLKNYAKEGDRILDTHLGSGSSAIAALDGGFDFVGCEIDKDYFDAAKKRFDIHCMQQKLF